MVYLKMKKNNNKGPNFFQAFGQVLPRVAKVSPFLFISGTLLNIIDGFTFALMVPITQLFLDRATDFAAHKNGIMSVVWALGILGVAHTVKNALNGVAYFINMDYKNRASGILSIEIHEKMSRIAPISFEDTQVLDNINKAVKGKDCANQFVNSVLLSITVFSTYFIGMAIYLYFTEPILSISILFIFIPTLLSQVLSAKLFANAENKAAQVRRRFEYYENCMVGREYFKETRILGVFDYFKKIYVETLSDLNRLTFQASLKSNLFDLGTKLLSLLGYIGVLLLLFMSLMNSKISVGAFLAIFTSLGQMFSMMEEIVCKHYGNIARDFGKVQNYLMFMKMDELSGEEIEVDADSDIDLEDVSFTYPKARQKAIDNVNLTIRQGETIALVGENGSGKSTLVRLITGIYQPDEGEVRYGDYNTSTVSSHSFFKNISGVFQKFQRYQMTMRDNIGISDVGKSTNDHILDKVCIQAGINKNNSSLKEGYETMLSREFGGVDLSGGQWQRLAISRSFFRKHNVIILDEPTAAIDPVEETKIYNRFVEISKGKTSLIVTHRLGSARIADKILVMKHGKLVEQGTHDELLANKGEYARLYMSQQQWYESSKITKEHLKKQLD